MHFIFDGKNGKPQSTQSTQRTAQRKAIARVTIQSFAWWGEVK